MVNYAQMANIILYVSSVNVNDAVNMIVQLFPGANVF